MAGLPGAGLRPADAGRRGAFYLYADVSRISPTTAATSAGACCARPAWRRRPASTSTAPAAPARLRISFAGSTAEMEEAVRRLKAWRRGESSSPPALLTPRSFDCAKASNAVERAICKDPGCQGRPRDGRGLRASDRLSGPGEGSSGKDQVLDRAQPRLPCTDGSRLPEDATAAPIGWILATGPILSSPSSDLRPARSARSPIHIDTLSAVRRPTADFPRSTASFADARKGRRRRSGRRPIRPRPDGWAYDRASRSSSGARCRHRVACQTSYGSRRRARQRRTPSGRSAHRQGGAAEVFRAGRLAEAMVASSAPTSRSSSSRSPASTKRWSPPVSPSCCASPATIAGTPAGWR